MDASGFDALGNPELRDVLRLVRNRQDAATADDVARELGLPRSVARWRLERLVQHGLLVPQFARRSGRSGPGAGRPAKAYAVAPETAALEFPRRRYEELLGLLIEAVPGRERAGRLAEIGVAFGRDLARAGGVRPAARAATAFDRICRALGALGFQAGLQSLTRDRAVLVTPTCPLRPLVMKAEAAREIDRGMWRGLVASALRSANVGEVRCETRGCFAGASSCRVEIRLG
jgi:predicted ArsR family transcriptional regulator